jgi:hypothetical protein
MAIMDPSNIDWPLTSTDKFAQFAGIAACILGFAATMLFFLSFFLQCLLNKKYIWRILLPILLILAGVLQILTFTAAQHMCRCPLRTRSMAPNAPSSPAPLAMQGVVRLRRLSCTCSLALASFGSQDEPLHYSIYRMRLILRLRRRKRMPLAMLRRRSEQYEP